MKLLFYGVNLCAETLCDYRILLVSAAALGFAVLLSVAKSKLLKIAKKKSLSRKAAERYTPCNKEIR